MSDEPQFNDGVRVNIFDAASKLVATARTNFAGNFIVASLPDGKYTAVATSYADRGFVVNGPATFTIAGGKAVSGLNIQLKAFGEISGQIFEDANVNGVFEQVVGAVIGGPAPEAILAGATVTLDLNSDGTIDRTTTSDADGKYTFGNIPDGSHAIATSLAGYTAPRTVSVVFQGGDRLLFVLELLGGQGYQLRVGVLPEDVDSYVNDTFNLGLTKSAVIALGVFEDANRNGVQEFDERGIPNATIQIDLDSNGSVDLTKTTTQTGTSS